MEFMEDVTAVFLVVASVMFIAILSFIAFDFVLALLERRGRK